MISEYTGSIKVLSSLAGLMAAASLCVHANEAAAPSKGPAAKGVDPSIVGEEVAVLTQAPLVPPPIRRSHATKVIVKLEVREVVRKLSDGVEYLFWTNGPENLLAYSGKEVDAAACEPERP